MLDSENNVSRFFGGIATSTPLSSGQNQETKKPVFKTVEEIERELLEGDHAAQTPKPVEEVVNQTKPKIMMAEDLERELIQESPMPTQKEMESIGRSPFQALSQTNQIFNQQETPSNLQNQTPQKQNVPFPHPNNTNLMGSPGVNFGGVHPGTPVMNANSAFNNFLMMEQQKQAMLVRQGLLPAPGHPVIHPGMVPGGVLPPQLAQNFHPGLNPMQHQHNIRMLQMHPHLRARLPMMIVPPGIPPHLRPPVHQQMGFNQPPQGFRQKMTKTDDPFRGLMNEKDKQRLRNIQIIQLQNDHPFTTDYFNLVRSRISKHCLNTIPVLL